MRLPLLLRGVSDSNSISSGGSTSSSAAAAATASVATTCCSLILRFDGSLRYPPDPGFPVITTTSRLGRMASCAACLMRTDDGEDDTYESDDSFLTNRKEASPTTTPPLIESGQIITLGGKRLHTHSIETSAQAEYEGLLFGLDGLFQFLNYTYHETELEFPATTSSSVSASPATPKKYKVMVQSDCKTLVSQMQGRSKPRLLVDQHNRATDQIDRIRDIVVPYGSSSSGGGGDRRHRSIEFHFEHIPRTRNHVCDQLCGKIHEHDVAGAVRLARQELRDCVERSSDSSAMLLHPYLQRHFLPGSNSRIPMSQRPRLYREIVHVALRLRDYETVALVGEWLHEEVKTGWSLMVVTAPTTKTATDLLNGSSDNTSKDETTVGQQHESIAKTSSLMNDPGPSNMKERLLVEALFYQLEGLRGLGRTKESKQLERKYRYLLGKYANSYLTEDLQLSLTATLPTVDGGFNIDDDDDEQKDLRSNNLFLPDEVNRWYDAATKSQEWHDHGMFWCEINK